MLRFSGCDAAKKRVTRDAQQRENQQNRIGETALQKAVQNRDSGIAKLLIDAGASPDVTDSSGRSARSAAENDPRAAVIVKMFAQVPVRKARPTQGPSL